MIWHNLVESFVETFFTSDLHLGEERMSIMSRPFPDGQACVEHMIHEHNLIVKPDDRVIIAGDVCYQKRLDMLPVIDRFNGRKTLIRGNHDRGLSDSDLAPYFDRVIPDGDGLELNIGGLDCYVTHYPTRGVADRFNLVGHIHSAWKIQLNMLNVGVDVHHFRPLSMNSVLFFYKAICDFYDEDVWVAYRDMNNKWYNRRGKTGSYFVNQEDKL